MVGNFFESFFDLGDVLATQQKKLDDMRCLHIASTGRIAVDRYMQELMDFAVTVPECGYCDILDPEAKVSDAQILHAVKRGRRVSAGPLMRLHGEPMSEDEVVEGFCDFMEQIFGAKTKTLDEVKKQAEIVKNVSDACGQFCAAVMVFDTVDEAMMDLIDSAATVELAYIAVMDMVIEQVRPGLDGEFSKTEKELHDDLVAKRSEMCAHLGEFLTQFEEKYPRLFGDSELNGVREVCESAVSVYA